MFDGPISVRNNIKIMGRGDTTVLLAHGFGCDQNMWRFLTPSLEPHFKIVLFDYVGSGNSQLSAYSSSRYSSLDGYAKDIIDVCDALQLTGVHFIGHSVSCMTGLIASIERPELFSSMTMVCPSPCFLNHPPEYMGGFERQDLEELISLMDKNYIGWANYLAPLIMGTENGEELTGELAGSFCSTDPLVAKNFARATFFPDHRELLDKTPVPCLILQSGQDSLAPTHIGQYMHGKITNNKLIEVDASGHCLHMTHPKSIDDDIIKFIAAHSHAAIKN